MASRFVNNPYRKNANNAAQSQQMVRTPLAGTTPKVIEGKLVPFVNPLPTTAKIIGARLSDFGVGGAYVTIYAELEGQIPASVRLGTFKSRIDSAQANAFVSEQEAKLGLASFERDCVVRDSGELYSRKMVGMVGNAADE